MKQYCLKIDFFFSA